MFSNTVHIYRMKHSLINNRSCPIFDMAVPDMGKYILRIRKFNHVKWKLILISKSFLAAMNSILCICLEIYTNVIIYHFHTDTSESRYHFKKIVVQSYLYYL